MASIVRFTPLYGVKSPELAVCSLLELDDYRILLDCGWNEHFDVDQVEPLRAVAPQVDAVLISHPDVMHVGALPYLVGKLGLEAPILTTLPVWRMGQMFMYDAYVSKRMQEDFDTFDLDDVDSTFDRITQLKFQQPFNLEGKGSGIVITPYSAGHMLGGTVWKIKKAADEMKDAEEILYAVDFNHRKERHLNPTALPSLTRPSHLIIGASQALTRFTPKVDLFEPILAALYRGGNVLVPVDSAGRVVELGLLFDEAWTEKKMQRYPVAIVHSVAFNTFDFARSMIEWMSDSVSNKFDLNRENPFQFKNVHLCHTKAEVDALPSPKVVLASFPAMEIGFSLDYFLDWAGDERNLVLLVDRVEKDTLAHGLKSAQVPFHMSRMVKRRVALEGAELREWRENQRQKDAEGNKGAETAHPAQDGDEANDNLESGISQDEDEDGPEITTAPQVFQFQEATQLWDDYGEVVDVNQFMIGEDPGEDDDALDDEDMDLAPDVAVRMEAVVVSDEARAPPTKCIEERVDIDVRCEIVTRDYSGLSDGRSVKELIVAVAPRRLIVIHGTVEETRAVADMGLNALGLSADAVVCPSKRDTVDVTSDTSVYRLKLDDSIFRGLRWRHIADGDIAYVRGTIRVEQTGEHEDVVLENTDTGGPSGHPTIFVGDARLNELKKKLSMAHPDLRPDFAQGVLYTEDPEDGSVVTIRKNAPGDFTMSANLSEEYFAVRDHFYTHFVTL